MTKQQIIKTTLYMLFMFYCVAIFFVTVKTAGLSYSDRDGFVLANRTLLGGDFLAFYSAGYMSDWGAFQLYDYELQAKVMNVLVGSAISALDGVLVCAYPPLVFVFFSWVKWFEFDTAYFIWAGFSFVLGLLVIQYLLFQARVKKSLHFFALIATLGFMPFILNSVFGGQVPLLGFFLLAGVAVLLFKHHDLAAGLLFGLAYYKPPLFLFLGVALIIWKGSRLSIGLVFSVVFFSAATIFYVGLDGLINYLDIASRYTIGQNFHEDIQLPSLFSMGLFGFLAQMFGAGSGLAITLFLLSYGVCLGLVWLLRPHVDAEQHMHYLFYAYVSIVSLFLSVQINKYDLSLLLIPFALILCVIDKLSIVKRYIICFAMSLFYIEWLLRIELWHCLPWNFAVFCFLFVIAILTYIIRSEAKAIKAG